MRKTALILVMVILAVTLLGLACSGEPIVPETASPDPTSTAQPEGVVIPRSIVIAIVVGAVAVGGFGGYYYARKRK